MTTSSHFLPGDIVKCVSNCGLGNYDMLGLRPSSDASIVKLHKHDMCIVIANVSQTSGYHYKWLFLLTSAEARCNWSSVCFASRNDYFEKVT